MQLEDVLIQIVKEMKPEVEIFVNAQKRKDTRTVEQMYLENLRKEKRKNKSIPRKETSQIYAQKNRLKPFKKYLKVFKFLYICI